METDNFQRVTEKSFKAQINFDKAKADLRKNELKEKDIIELQAFLNAAETNPKINIKSINLIGFASPEGEEGRNGSLSSERAGTAKTAAMEIAKKAKKHKSTN